MREETSHLGKNYIRSLFAGLGFRVEYAEMVSQNRQQLIEFTKLCIDDALLSVNGALISMEAGLEPFDIEQMSVCQELMSIYKSLLTFEYELKSRVSTQEAICNMQEAFNPDQLSVVKALKSITRTLKPIVDALK